MNIKDKLRLFHQLKNEREATVDLSLLKEKLPYHTLIPRFERCPKRCAHDILYLLLDVASEEEILANRKKNAPKKTPVEKEKKDSDKGSSETLTEQETETTSETLSEEKEESADDGSSDTLTETETDDAAVEANEPDAQNPSEEDDSKKK